MEIISRARWGAKYSAGFTSAPLPAQELWLHHSAGAAPDLLPPYDDDYAVMRTLESIGQSRFGGGVSYTFVVSPAGLIFEGHGVNRQGAHTRGRNDIARAICMMGNYDNMKVTNKQIEAIRWLIALGRSHNWWTVSKLSGGHQNAPGAETACPGKNGMAAIPLINSSVPLPLEDDMSAADVNAINSNTNTRTGILDKNSKLRLEAMEVRLTARIAATEAAIAADPKNPVTQKMLNTAVSTGLSRAKITVTPGEVEDLTPGEDENPTPEEDETPTP